MARSRGGDGSRNSFLLSAERRGLSQGIFNGKRGWLYIGTGLWTIRTVRRFAGRKTEILLSEELKPGQRLIIANNRATIEGAPVVAAPAKGRRKRRG